MRRQAFSLLEVLIALALVAGTVLPTALLCSRLFGSLDALILRTARLDALWSSLEAGRSGTWAGQTVELERGAVWTARIGGADGTAGEEWQRTALVGGENP